MSIIREYLDSVSAAIADLSETAIRDCIDTVKQAHSEGRQVFLLGNGGSAANATHIAEDLQKGVKVCTGKRFKVVSLTESVPLITAWANDTDYDSIFAEQIDSMIEPRDVVIAISGSGNSPNVLRAVERAKQMGAITIGWSGFSGGKLAGLVDRSIVVKSDNMQRIEDIHLILGHLLFSCMMKECSPTA